MTNVAVGKVDDDKAGQRLSLDPVVDPIGLSEPRACPRPHPALGSPPTPFPPPLEQDLLPAHTGMGPPVSVRSCISIGQRLLLPRDVTAEIWRLALRPATQTRSAAVGAGGVDRKGRGGIEKEWFELRCVSVCPSVLASIQKASPRLDIEPPFAGAHEKPGSLGESPRLFATT